MNYIRDIRSNKPMVKKNKHRKQRISVLNLIIKKITLDSRAIHRNFRQVLGPTKATEAIHIVHKRFLHWEI